MRIWYSGLLISVIYKYAHNLYNELRYHLKMEQWKNALHITYIIERCIYKGGNNYFH